MRGRDSGREPNDEVASDDDGSENGLGRDGSFDGRYDDASADEISNPPQEEDDVVEQTNVRPKKKLTRREKSRQKRLQAKLARKSSIPLTYSGLKEFMAQKKKDLYFKLQGGSSKIPREPHWTRMRVKVSKFISTHAFEAFMGAVILSNIFLIMLETERRSYCEDPTAASCPANFPDIWVPDLIFLLFYIMELLMRIYVYQNKFCRIPWNVFDFFVVTVSVMGEVLGGHFKDAVIIRIVRIARLARMLRLLTWFQELYLLFAGFASTLRTVFWAVIMLFAVISVFSLIAVEILKPVAADVAAAGGFGDCERCPKAFESLSSSMFTFFQTLIMGEGIGDIMVPMMKASWYSNVFILSVVAMVYLGILNLILSVIVEKSSEARTQDAFYQSLIHKKLKADAKKVFLDFTRDADMDMNNMLSLQELRTAYSSQENFRSYFKSMDIDLPFLEYAFRAHDRKGRGECSLEGFADAVTQMRNIEVAPVVSFLRCQVAEVLDEISTLSEEIQAVGSNLSRHISQVGAEAAHSISTIPRPGTSQQPRDTPGIAATLFGGSWFTALGGGHSDDENSDYDGQGYHNNYRKPYMPQHDILGNDHDFTHAAQEDLGLDGATAPLPPHARYPPTPSKWRQKQREQANEGWSVPGNLDEVKPRRKDHHNGDRDSAPPDVESISARIAELREKNDIPLRPSNRPKQKKRKKGKHYEV
eukprot:CAMPEP_0172781784 /NCGR_PEP_ID=MMETSP1074-20121228/203602_1 /TAXON_ID=2916 /ORGANISM="Ceratium fusus, Strain PA161109" /LENGTH=701 /DNA_ID=CAMNT_0013618761 /DNA_START=24 /DNA_END=2129 /DNA_ORIENTATION=+